MSARFSISIRNRCPFDWKTPIGYLVAWFAQWAGACPVACIFIQFLNFVFGSCWLFIFIAEDIGQDVDAFNSIAKTASRENHAELTKRFRDIVQTYTDAKKYGCNFIQLFKKIYYEMFDTTHGIPISFPDVSMISTNWPSIRSSRFFHGVSLA